MPNQNQTGPMGQGSMTGRRMGRCTNFGADQNVQTSVSNETPVQTFPGNFAGKGSKGGCRGGRGQGMGRQNRSNNGL